MHSWIKDLGYGRSEEENVFYALLEQAELLGGANEEETFAIYFDAVVAGDLEAMPLNGESLSLENEWWRECRSALLEITLTTQQFINWIGTPEDEIYGIWFKITLSENPVGDMVNTPVQNFMNLIDDPIQKYLKSIDRLDKNDRKLKALSDCLNGLEATDRLLWEDTSAIPNEEICAVNVIDVGQGNMNVVEAGNAGDAIIFYDFGGGVGANRQTWPKHPNIPSRLHTKLVVLSHWDHDHWAGVMRLTKNEFDEICNIPWWVPNQLIGINHAKFARALYLQGKLRVLNAKKYLSPTSRLHAGRNAFIFGCNGAITDRNNSGLAMHLLGPEFRSMLLPGDASYDSIADINWWSYVAMVASHHGGLSSGRPPAAIPPAKLAYSYGKGNTHGHPISWRVAEHNDAGWRYHAATANRGGGLSRGNIRLEFT